MTARTVISAGMEQSSVHAPRYDADLYGWLESQIEVLGEGRLADIDAENLAEELADISVRLKHELKEALIDLAQNFLGRDLTPAFCAPDCAESIALRRRDIARLLTRSPGLRSVMAQSLPYCYDIAWLRFLGQNDEIPENDVSAVCPYTIDDLLNRSLVPESPPTRGKRRGSRTVR